MLLLFILIDVFRLDFQLFLSCFTGLFFFLPPMENMLFFCYSPPFFNTVFDGAGEGSIDLPL